MNVFQAIGIHLLVGPVVFGVVSLLAWRGWMGYRQAAFTLAAYGAVLTIIIGAFVAQFSFLFLIPAIPPVLFLICTTSTNRVTASIQVLCLLTLFVIGVVTIPLYLVGLLYLWSFLAMALAMLYLDDDLKLLKRRRTPPTAPQHAG